MSTTRLTRSKDSDEGGGLLSRPRRECAPKSYKETSDLVGASNNNSDAMEVDDEEASTESTTEDDDLMEVEEEKADNIVRTSSRRRVIKPSVSSLEKPSARQKTIRTSSRSTKFNSSMTEPSASLNDLLSRKEQLIDTDDEVEETYKPRPRKRTSSTAAVTTLKQNTKESSPHKSPARRHVQRRRSLPPSNDSELVSETESASESDDGNDEDEEPMKVQRIIARRTESKKVWKELCQNMNTSEVDNGSRWFQSNDGMDADVMEERFLVKWAGLSFLHTSWETQHDLVEQADAKTYMTTFSRKAVNGLLYSPDERCDGDYFDPAWKEVERILSVQLPEKWDKAVELTAETEDGWDSKSFGIILDKADRKFESGSGRQFLVKWCNSPYGESTYEFERDLIMNEIEYKGKLKDFLKRRVKPTAVTRRAVVKDGNDEFKRLYKIFGDKTKRSDDEHETVVEEYKQTLQEEVYKNGGQLRDYQAEGVAWMIANYMNQRSCILADEMGLGKTLQIAASIRKIAKLARGPILVVAPLTTLTHWYREFTAWTNLNAVVYHGSAEDRRVIRENEFAYEVDRPEASIPFNQLYLKKCLKKNTKTDSPWMIDVVITSPEIMIADDAKELTALEWDILVVDEAHRLKNFNSKLAVGLRDEKFKFHHRILLTGTPIQNDVKEFWTLLNFIDPEGFASSEKFMEKYGDMKSKETVDELHEEIRPYILRRLKEDVERSVPPKEETLIEVELTVAQKQYYRALFEKNVKFLNKDKKKPIDGPSLNNLAMQLRKVCNHLYLLNGIEEEFRRKQEPGLSEAEFLVRGSGKLVLLDKLLPRLKEQGHRVLVFSQFKIMLDILEDYLNARNMKFERIDGSITGNKRQQAIDRYQTPSTTDKEAPFIMMLSTRAGGVGITLTAADTCIIFDSDWNPQNDLQAQARCHRIGQTKSVKVYRLLTRKTYEMQMFHMSSLKMGLDQAVLKGFESRSTGEGALSKDEVERLLRHGAYDLFNEDKAGESEAKSNDFVQQDIDSILQRHSHTIVHENTGSKSTASGGTFSKASFKAKATDPNSLNKDDDIDIEDPDFWKKMIGEGTAEDSEEIGVRRSRTQKNYSDKIHKKELEESIRLDSDAGNSSSDESDDPDEGKRKVRETERLRWGGSNSNEWKREDVEVLIKAICSFGYNQKRWPDSLLGSDLSRSYDPEEVKRMCWTVVLLTIMESADDESKLLVKREAKAAEKLLEKSYEHRMNDEGGVLAIDRSVTVKVGDSKTKRQEAFEKVWRENLFWMEDVISDAAAYSNGRTPRQRNHPQPAYPLEVDSVFATRVWPSLKAKGWTSKTVLGHNGSGTSTTEYSFLGKKHFSRESVLKEARRLYPDLKSAVDGLLAPNERTAQASVDQKGQLLHDTLSASTSDINVVTRFLDGYGAKQLLFDRDKPKRIRLPRRVLSTSSLLHHASTLVHRAGRSPIGNAEAINKLAAFLGVDKRLGLPHPLWTSRHDAVLIHAILKHGWIDSDTVARAVAEDTSVIWGPPFDKPAVSSSSGSIANVNTENILRTADRAAAFLNNHSDLLDELKGFDRQLLVGAYCLVRQEVDEGDFFQLKERSWVVDQSSFLAACGHPNVGGSGDSADLPAKKDLVKRAKSILSKAPSLITLSKKPTSAYPELDQKDGANMFLAELLRALLRESPASKHYRRLCTWAYDEARHRATSLSSETDGTQSKSSADLQRISELIDEYKGNVSKATIQYKNVLRAVLGEETHKTRKEGECIFPVKKHFTALQTTTTTLTTSTVRESLDSAGPRASSRPSGEKAIDQARRKLGSRYVSPGDSAVVELELTEVETLIMTAACRLGFPVWKKEWRDVLSNRSLPGITWTSFGNQIVKLAEKSYLNATAKLAKERARAAETRKPASSLIAVDRLARKQRAAESTFYQSREYAIEPENLAKKSLMLVEKVLRQIPEDALVQSDEGLGSKVVVWLRGEILRWAISLELTDDDGRPLALSAVEFLPELPEAERQSIEISSLFDKQCCGQVANQVAMMTRGRSFLSEQSRVRSEISRASQVLHSSGTKWDTKPDEWSDGNDYVLFKRLMADGLTEEILTATSTFGEANSSSRLAFAYDFVGLTRRSLQLRANQLVTVLHESFPRILEDRQNEHVARRTESSDLKPGHPKGTTSRHPIEEIEVSDDEVQVLSPEAAALESQRAVSSSASAQSGKRKKEDNDLSLDQKRRSL